MVVLKVPVRSLPESKYWGQVGTSSITHAREPNGSRHTLCGLYCGLISEIEDPDGQARMYINCRRCLKVMRDKPRYLQTEVRILSQYKLT